MEIIGEVKLIVAHHYNIIQAAHATLLLSINFS